MSPNTSSDNMPPMPPIVRALMLIFTVGMTLIMIAFISLMAVEFVAEMAGFPSHFVVPAADDFLLTDQDGVEELKSPFELITPGHETQIRGPEVVVIYTERITPTDSPLLWINDIQHPWEMQYGDNTWFARLQLPAGRHHVQAGETEADFFVYLPETTQRLPEHWVLHRPHPDTDEVDRCTNCHEMSDRSLHFLVPGRDGTIGAWQGKSSCFVAACHNEERHDIIHSYNLPSAERSLRCVRCHSMH